MRPLALLLTVSFLALYPIALMAQEPKTSILEEVTDNMRFGSPGWTFVASPPQPLMEKILGDHLIENTEPLFADGNSPSFEYAFFFYNESRNIYRVVFHKSVINEKCGRYDGVVRFYHYKVAMGGFERVPNNGESGYAKRTSCDH